MYSVCTKVYQDIAVYKIIGGSSLQLNEQNLAHRYVPYILVLFFLLMSKSGPYGAKCTIIKVVQVYKVLCLYIFIRIKNWYWNRFY